MKATTRLLSVLFSILLSVSVHAQYQDPDWDEVKSRAIAAFEADSKVKMARAALIERMEKPNPANQSRHKVNLGEIQAVIESREFIPGHHYGVRVSQLIAADGDNYKLRSIVANVEILRSTSTDRYGQYVWTAEVGVAQ